MGRSLYVGKRRRGGGFSSGRYTPKEYRGANFQHYREHDNTSHVDNDEVTEDGDLFEHRMQQDNPVDRNDNLGTHEITAQNEDYIKDLELSDQIVHDRIIGGVNYKLRLFDPLYDPPNAERIQAGFDMGKCFTPAVCRFLLLHYPQLKPFSFKGATPNLAMENSMFQSYIFAMSCGFQSHIDMALHLKYNNLLRVAQREYKNSFHHWSPDGEFGVNTHNFVTTLRTMAWAYDRSFRAPIRAEEEEKHVEEEVSIPDDVRKDESEEYRDDQPDFLMNVSDSFDQNDILEPVVSIEMPELYSLPRRHPPMPKYNEVLDDYLGSPRDAAEPPTKKRKIESPSKHMNEEEKQNNDKEEEYISNCGSAPSITSYTCKDREVIGLFEKVLEIPLSENVKDRLRVDTQVDDKASAATRSNAIPLDESEASKSRSRSPEALSHDKSLERGFRETLRRHEAPRDSQEASIVEQRRMKDLKKKEELRRIFMVDKRREQERRRRQEARKAEKEKEKSASNTEDQTKEATESEEQTPKKGESGYDKLQMLVEAKRKPKMQSATEIVQRKKEEIARMQRELERKEREKKERERMENIRMQKFSRREQNMQSLQALKQNQQEVIEIASEDETSFHMHDGTENGMSHDSRQSRISSEPAPKVTSILEGVEEENVEKENNEEGNNESTEQIHQRLESERQETPSVETARVDREGSGNSGQENLEKERPDQEQEQEKSSTEQSERRDLQQESILEEHEASKLPQKENGQDKEDHSDHSPEQDESNQEDRQMEQIEEHDVEKDAAEKEQSVTTSQRTDEQESRGMQLQKNPNDENEETSARDQGDLNIDIVNTSDKGGHDLSESADMQAQTRVANNSETTNVADMQNTTNQKVNNTESPHAINFEQLEDEVDIFLDNLFGDGKEKTKDGSENDTPSSVFDEAPDGLDKGKQTGTLEKDKEVEEGPDATNTTETVTLQVQEQVQVESNQDQGNRIEENANVNNVAQNMPVQEETESNQLQRDKTDDRTNQVANVAVQPELNQEKANQKDSDSSTASVTQPIPSQQQIGSAQPDSQRQQPVQPALVENVIPSQIVEHAIPSQIPAGSNQAQTSQENIDRAEDFVSQEIQRIESDYQKQQQIAAREQELKMKEMTVLIAKLQEIDVTHRREMKELRGRQAHERSSLIKMIEILRSQITLPIPRRPSSSSQPVTNAQSNLRNLNQMNQGMNQMNHGMLTPPVQGPSLPPQNRQTFQADAALKFGQSSFSYAQPQMTVQGRPQMLPTQMPPNYTGQQAYVANNGVSSVQGSRHSSSGSPVMASGLAPVPAQQQVRQPTFNTHRVRFACKIHPHIYFLLGLQPPNSPPN
ncbi:uncharacterized protein J8A68_004251 [[Candida] subhashii]|uniref:Uncharacterized protein n=1 Tax=[Candida] subhashii TaxID=561895 RepID=A0A8J5QBJ7_9ASCO|nr:uncharacterized protein J8A68_004251 [[Candida] subhashii]KAG7662241.1 hypothetical protein J8A68_004251 [[Candida] subhashii]